MASLSTHVLDTGTGRPAAGIRVDLADADALLGSGTTDSDGRITDLVDTALTAGPHTLTFHTGAYFTATGTAHLFPHVAITFTVADQPDAHYHVPLLLSPFAYSTYRGS